MPAINTERSILLANSDCAAAASSEPLSSHPEDTSHADRSSISESRSRTGRIQSSRCRTRERNFTIALGSSSFQCSSLATSLFLTVVAIIAGVVTIISLPIATGSFQNHISCGHFRPISSTIFLQIFSMLWTNITIIGVVAMAKFTTKDFNMETTLSHRQRCLTGLFVSLTLFLSTYASLPNRTPPTLQAVFYVTMIPLTIILRWVFLRKTVSVPRLICAFGVMVGTFIVLEPTIFKLNEEDTETASHQKSSIPKAVWTLMFASANIPIALLSVLMEYAFERNVSSQEDINHPLVLTMWMMIWSLVFMVAFSLTEFIPEFGEATSLSDFLTSLGEGFSCMFGVAPSPGNCTAALVQTAPLPGELNPDPHCLIPIGHFWVYFIAALFNLISNLVLIKYSDGAICSAIAQSVTAPLAAMFWRFFRLDRYSNLKWHPVLNTTAAYVFVGLCFIIPAVAVYNYLSYKEEVAGSVMAKDSQRNENETDGAFPLLAMSELKTSRHD